VTELGQIALLVAFVAAGFSAFCCLAGWRWDHRPLRRCGVVCAAVSVIALTAAAALLAWALCSNDFRFAYVAQNSSRGLPWYYSLSALWVGQAGSLLVWAWLLGLVALAHRFLARRDAGPLAEPAFAVEIAYLCFLVAVMVFGADPMEPSIGNPREGAGLSPLLQHPAMLIHPPLVFFGYACWTIPFALATATLVTGQLDAAWARQARPWSLLAWIVLGIGILWGAEWAYEELGWGGYWSWDPVENGSLIPWLTGTALVHTSLAWRRRGVLKKTSLLLAVATFGLCNFATFLTRSGIFGSLHAFSRSPIGWMFLGLLLVLVSGSVLLLVWRRAKLRPEKPLAGVWTREALVAISTVALLLLAGVALAGTLAVPLSDVFLGRKMIVGAAFYNNVLIPIGLVLLATTAMAPLARWGEGVTAVERRLLLASLALGGVAAATAFVSGVRHPIAVAVIGLAVLAAAAVTVVLLRDAKQASPVSGRASLLRAFTNNRRQYAGFLIHLGFVCLAVGVAGSALGTQKQEAVVHEGEIIQWAGRSIHFAHLTQRDLPDRLIVEAQLDVSQGGSASYALSPAQHLYRLQGEWRSHVAIHSTWGGDFYTILHGGEGPSRVSFTFAENPMMRWLWLSGWVAGAGALVGLWPTVGRNPKSETRNPKQIQIPKASMTEARTGGRRDKVTPVLYFVLPSFGFVSDFVFRISDLAAPFGPR